MTYKRKPRQCLNCHDTYVPRGNCSKYCDKCKELMDKKRMQDYHKKVYERKGYNQLGESNNNWKGGIGIYRQIKAPVECEKCGAENNLLVHHKDGDRYNNRIENLQSLCKRCHQIEHECWKALPKNTELSLLKKEQAITAKRDRSGKFTK